MDQLVAGPGAPLTDAQWARIDPLLPDRTPKRGVRRRDHREVIDAFAFNFQTGTQ
ncbi:transposase [Streptomyces kronopolitis]